MGGAARRPCRTIAAFPLPEGPMSQTPAPLSPEDAAALYQALRAEGMAILLVEQNLEVCTQLADRHCILEQGRIVYTASNAAFMADEEVKDRYLGVGLV